MVTEKRNFRVKITTFPSTGERFVLVEGPPNGIALDATTLYGLMVLRERGCSPSTMYLAMQAFAIMLEWAWTREPRIDLEERLGTGLLFEAAEIHSLRRELRLKLTASSRGDDSVTVGSGHYYNRCYAVRDYVAWHAENAIRRIPTREHGRAVEHRRRLEDFQVSMVANLPSPRTKTREGVDEEVQRIFLEAIRPGSPTNPSRRSTRLGTTPFSSSTSSTASSGPRRSSSRARTST